MNNETRFEIGVDDNLRVKQVDKLKYLGAVVDKVGLGKEEIKSRTRQSRKVI